MILKKVNSMLYFKLIITILKIKKSKNNLASPTIVGSKQYRYYMKILLEKYKIFRNKVLCRCNMKIVQQIEQY